MVVAVTQLGIEMNRARYLEVGTAQGSGAVAMKWKRRGRPPPFRRSVSGERLPLNSGADDEPLLMHVVVERASPTGNDADATLVLLAIQVFAVGGHARRHGILDTDSKTVVIPLRQGFFPVISAPWY